MLAWFQSITSSVIGDLWPLATHLSPVPHLYNIKIHNENNTLLSIYPMSSFLYNIKHTFKLCCLMLALIVCNILILLSPLLSINYRSIVLVSTKKGNWASSLKYVRSFRFCILIITVCYLINTQASCYIRENQLQQMLSKWQTSHYYWRRQRFLWAPSQDLTPVLCMSV